jgi:long-chain-alcohol oxidase
MFERGAFLTTEDGGMSILAGATMGGGTKINWCASLRTPDHVRREWATKHGLPRFDTPEFDTSLDSVLSRLGVQSTTNFNGSNGVLYDGLCELGKHAEKLPRNCRSDECSGYCSLGCKTGHKVSTDASYLADAAKRGARVLTCVRARRVLLEANPDAGSESGEGAVRHQRAAGVEVAVGGDDDDFNSGVKVVIKAPLVIASAGSIHTVSLAQAGRSVGQVEVEQSAVNVELCPPHHLCPPHPQRSLHSPPCYCAAASPAAATWAPTCVCTPLLAFSATLIRRASTALLTPATSQCSW